MEVINHNLSAYLMIGSLGLLLFGSLVYGIFTAFGADSAQLTDQIEKHARLHKLGIAHSHRGSGRDVARGARVHTTHDTIQL